MATRRDSREWAVQVLFQLDLNPAEKLDEVFSEFWNTLARSRRDSGKDQAPDSARAFTEGHVRGVLEHQEEIDAFLTRIAEHWDVGRMGVIDRNVIRLSLYEMLFRDDIPPVVSINEGVDLAKYFSSSESGKFVNGLLDRARKETDRPAREAKG